MAISPTETGVAAQLYPAGRTIMGCGPGAAGSGVGPNAEVPGGGTPRDDPAFSIATALVVVNLGTRMAPWPEDCTDDAGWERNR